MHDLRSSVERELRSNILPFWLKYAVDEEFGGFCGQIANDLTIDHHANKGLILNARILWTFSKAFSVYREEQYELAAHRAFDYLVRFFWDARFGGVYWMVNYEGDPIDTKKRIYGQAFTIYALAEYYRATGNRQALHCAFELQSAVENASHDSEHGGYFETYERDWSLAQDQRLSEVDMDEKKSMNTHLHVLEAYANLLRVSPEAPVGNRLRDLLSIFLDHIIDEKTHHFRMFFDEQWNPKSTHISYGHDIEGSWLLCEAAEILGDQGILAIIRAEGLRMAQAVYTEAVDKDGGILYESDGTHIFDTDKHWWAQAEAVVGFLNAYQLSGREDYLHAAQRSWNFIDKKIVDHDRGEWFWKVSRDGRVDNKQYKVDPWKCPYHNSRMCFEVMQRIDSLAKQELTNSVTGE